MHLMYQHSWFLNITPITHDPQNDNIFKTDQFLSKNIDFRGHSEDLAYLFWLVCSLLRVRLYLIVGMVCDFGHWLFED